MTAAGLLAEAPLAAVAHVSPLALIGEFAPKH